MNLLFRTDASVKIGTGHVMRCLALAQSVQDAGGRAIFAMAETTSAIEKRLGADSCEVVPVSCAAGSSDDAKTTIRFAQQARADWVVVDGYPFGGDYQDALRGAGCRSLFLDDYGHASHYSAHLVLNQNVDAEERLYENRKPDTQLLLGPRYALLRREFTPWRDWKREVSPVCRRLLVMMGGSDPDNLTALVIGALVVAGIENLEATVLVGGSNPHLAILRKLASESGLNISVRSDVANVGEMMAAADVAVSAAGSTCWELCLLGLPALLIDAARNQSAIAQGLHRRECAIHIGDETVGVEKIAAELTRLAGSQELRRRLSQKSRELVDGKGAARVLAVMRGDKEDLPPEMRPDTKGLRLRSACAEDSDLLWRWANDPEVRAASFSTEAISWETHSAWFAARLGSSRALIWIAEIWIAENGNGAPCAQVRFDARPDGEWEVDFSVAKEMRGGGLASRLLSVGVESLSKEHRGAVVHAYVKPGNTASLRALERADFMRLDTVEVRGHSAVHLVWHKRG